MAWLKGGLPPGGGMPRAAGYGLVTREGVNFARVRVQDLTGLQGSGGSVNIPVTLRVDATATGALKTLQIHIFTQETDTLNSNGHSTANNTAERVISQDIPVSLHSGLTVKAGWASEGGNGAKFGGAYDPDTSAAQYADGTEGGSTANISTITPMPPSQ